MMTSKKILGFLCLGMSLIYSSGCVSFPEADAVIGYAPSGVSEDEMREAILEGCQTRGWKCTAKDESNVKGWIWVRDHYAEVLITSTSKFSRPYSYRIAYVDSRNLSYDSQSNTIHSSYLSWVDNLSRDISNALRIKSQ
jgi:hypothetical protein